MDERHGDKNSRSSEDVAGAFSWHRWLEKLLEDEHFIEQLERAAARTLGGTEEVDDVLQEVWTKLLKRNRQLEDGSGPRAYVMSTVLGTALEFRKRRNLMRQREGAEPPERPCTEPSPLSKAAVQVVLQTVARIAKSYAAAKVGSPARRRHYQELLRTLRDHQLISAECYAFLRAHRPEARARRGAATVATTDRAHSL